MIEDLNKSHYKIWEKNPEISQSKEHTKKSIEFAIKILEIMIKELKEELNSFEGEDLTERDYGYMDCINDTISGQRTL